jgi:hypothetical protein
MQAGIHAAGHLQSTCFLPWASKSFIRGRLLQELRTFSYPDPSSPLLELMHPHGLGTVLTSRITQKTTCPPEAAESASQNANANTNFNPNPEPNPKPNLGSDSVPQARNDDGAEREVDEGLGQPENASTAARNAAGPDDDGADIVGAAAMSRIDRQIEIILSFPNDVNWDATAGSAFSPAVPTAGSTLGAKQCNSGATERPESVISNATASTAPSSAVATAGSTPGGTERPESLD